MPNSTAARLGGTTRQADIKIGKPKNKKELAETESDPAVFIPGTRLLKPNVIRQSVRPEGAPIEQGVDITDLSPGEKREITRKNIVSGLAAKKVEELGIIQEMQTAEREKALAPQLEKIGQEVPPSENIPELLKEKPAQKAVDIGQAAATGIGTAAATGAGATLAA